MPSPNHADRIPGVLSERLALALAHRGHTAYWLAQQANASTQAVLDVLAGAQPKSGRLAAMADALDVDTDWLLGREKKNRNNPSIPLDWSSPV